MWFINQSTHLESLGGAFKIQTVIRKLLNGKSISIGAYTKIKDQVHHHHHHHQHHHYCYCYS